jgi:hypothetical protein
VNHLLHFVERFGQECCGIRLWLALHGSFSTSIEAFERGDRPKLALMTPPQMGKSIAAEDFAAWIAG